MNQRLLGYTRAQIIGLAALLVIGWPLLGIFDRTTVSVLILGLYFAVGATSFNFLWASTGAFSLVQPVFLAVGGYTGVYLANEFGLSPWLSLLIAPILAGLLALPIAVAAIRAGTGTVLFALVTLIVALAVPPVLTSIEALGGAVGLHADLKPEPGFWDMQFLSPTPFARILLVMNVLLIAFWLGWKRSRLGYFATAIKDSPAASEAAGIPTMRVRIGTFVVAAMIAAPAGVVYAQYNLLSTPDLFLGLTPLFQVFVVALAGGYARVWGPLVGSVVIVYLTREISDLAGGRPGIGPLTFAALFAVIALVMPSGLSGAWAKLVDRLRARRGNSPGGGQVAMDSPDRQAPLGARE